MADDKTKGKDMLAEMRKQYTRDSEHCSTLYDQARDDIKFVVVPGHQWDSKLKARRGDRPCYEFPKLSGHTRQIINEMKQSRPQGKVRGVEDGDRALAEQLNVARAIAESFVDREIRVLVEKSPCS